MTLEKCLVKLIHNILPGKIESKEVVLVFSQQNYFALKLKNNRQRQWKLQPADSKPCLSILILSQFQSFLEEQIFRFVYGLIDTAVMFQYICCCRGNDIFFCGGGIEEFALAPPPP